MLGKDIVEQNNRADAPVTVITDGSTSPKLIIRRENLGTIRVELSGAQSNDRYVLETSEDLIRWSPLNVTLTGPTFSTALSSASASRRFFRAVPMSAPRSQ